MKVLFYLGICLVAGFPAMDLYMRFRMKRSGYRGAFVRGGRLIYGEYFRLRINYGWPAWPVYAMWALLVVGVTLTLVSVATLGGNP